MGKITVEKHGNMTHFLRRFNVLYTGQGTKCPYCTSYFSSSCDLKGHLETHWIETRKKNGWILDASLDPVLAARISNAGPLVEGRYRYILIGGGNSKKIYRSRAVNRF